MLAKSIGNHLEMNGIDVSQLSRKIGISEDELKLILDEKETMSCETYLKICCALHVTVNFFTRLIEEKEGHLNGQKARYENGS